MSIDRDDCDERQARLDRMINEFREAQSRRLMKANDEAVESQLGAKRKAPVTGSATSQ
jgi:vacuolar-type H+-ATPase subunit H